MTCEIQWSGDGVYRKFHGRFGRSDVELSTERVVRDPRFEGLRWSVVDFTDAELDEGSARLHDYIAGHAVLAAIRKRSHPGLLTVVVARDQATIAWLRFLDLLRLPPHPVEWCESPAAAWSRVRDGVPESR